MANQSWIIGWLAISGYPTRIQNKCYLQRGRSPAGRQTILCQMVKLIIII